MGARRMETYEVALARLFFRGGAGLDGFRGGGWGNCRGSSWAECDGDLEEGTERRLNESASK